MAWAGAVVVGCGFGRKGLDQMFRLVVVAAACRQKALRLLFSKLVGVGVEEAKGWVVKEVKGWVVIAGGGDPCGNGAALLSFWFGIKPLS